MLRESDSCIESPRRLWRFRAGGRIRDDPPAQTCPIRVFWRAGDDSDYFVLSAISSPIVKKKRDMILGRTDAVSASVDVQPDATSLRWAGIAAKRFREPTVATDPPMGPRDENPSRWVCGYAGIPIRVLEESVLRAESGVKQLCSHYFPTRYTILKQWS